MMLLAVGCNFRTTGVDLRERLAFDPDQLSAALEELPARYQCETAILSTCNRVEVYVARADTAAPSDAVSVGDFLAEFHHLPADLLRSHLYQHRDADAVRHLFRVAAGLDSLIVGEGQISGQVKAAYESACQAGAAGPLLHALFQHSRRVAGRVRSETGIARGNVSVASAAVEYVRQVFEHFGDKAVLVIGAGKMGGLTLRHLGRLQPRQILVTNRNAEKAAVVALACGGEAVPWDQLDDALAAADIVLSTTGAPQPVVTRERYARIEARRQGGPVVILDLAVPRDFDPAIHDGDRTCLFNIDDLGRIREQTLRDRLRHVGPAEAVVEQEVARFLRDWNRRRHGGAIARLTEDFETKRRAVTAQLMDRLDGRLSAEDRAVIEGAFRLLQNQFLHGPITALAEEPPGTGGHTLLEALRKLFRLTD